MSLKTKIIEYLLRDDGKSLLYNWLPEQERHERYPATKVIPTPVELRLQSLADDIKAALYRYVDRSDDGRNGTYTAADVLFAAKYVEVAVSMIDGVRSDRARRDSGDYGDVNRDSIITNMIDKYGYLEAAQQTLYDLMGGILTPDSDGGKSILDE